MLKELSLQAQLCMSAAGVCAHIYVLKLCCFLPPQVAAADCVVGKIGYGTTSECLAHGVPLVFLRRDFFNEEPFLRKLLEVS